MKSRRSVLLGVLAAVALPAAAQALSPADAQRYVNADGIEIIQNRGARRPDGSGSGASGKAAASTAPAPSAPAAQTGRALPEPGRITRERIDILSAELADEARELDTKNKLLRTPRGTNALLDEMYGRLQREVTSHQQNIQALHREIERVAGRRR